MLPSVPFISTVTCVVAVLLPSTVAAVIVATPGFLANTLPLSSTNAILISEELQLIDLLSALPGVTVAVMVKLSPSVTVLLVGSTVMPVTDTAFFCTVTAVVAVLPPSAVLAVIVALPACLPVTLPLLSTAATAASDELQ